METELLYAYINEIKKYPLLTAEEEVILAKQIASGNTAARTKLINSNLRLVINIAKKFASSNVPVMDLIQEGNLGLMAAVSKFNYEYKTRFSTYAYNWILQYMLRYVHTKAEIIHLPSKKKVLLHRISVVQNIFQQETGRKPSVKKVALYLGISEKEVCEAIDYPSCITSIDTPCGENDDLSVCEMLADTSSGPEENMMRKARNQELYKLVKTLPPAEMNVLYHRYNFENGKKTKTLREIGDILGVSAETVRQMEIRAIHRIQLTAKAQGSGILFIAA
jgi:RNA polymerase primary sigma factor